MKKLSIVIVACALALGAAACGKKKDPAAPAADTATEPAGDMGGDAYGGDAYGNPCDANPCG